MLAPKKVKHRKQQKGRVRGKAQRGNTLAFGDFGLQAMARNSCPARALRPFCTRRRSPSTGPIPVSAAQWARATVQPPKGPMRMVGGRKGRHTEHLGHLLAEMQIVARSHPGASW